MNKQVSIIVPVWNEQPSLRSLVGEVLQMFESSGWSGEIILVDDGSRDGSWETIETLASEHPEVRGIRFQRNFGKSSALQAGVTASRFPFLATMDGDLQDDPAGIPAMLELLQGPVDLVSGWKKNRLDPWDRRFASRIFNGLVSSLTGVRLHDHNCGLKVARREVYDSLHLTGGMHRFIPVLAASNGFRVGEAVVVHRERKHGQSKYGWERIPRGLRDLLTVCFLTVHRDRIQFWLGATGSLAVCCGMAGLVWMAVYWILRNAGMTDGPPLHQRPLVWYSLGSFLAGLQVLMMSFLAELILHRTQSPSSTYQIAAETQQPDLSGTAATVRSSRRQSG